MRGFEKGKIGPIDSGGDFIEEIIQPQLIFHQYSITLSTIESLDFTYFIDIANVWGVDYDSSLMKTQQTLEAQQV